MYIFFSIKTLVCFYFLAVIIMCLILWLLLKVILAYRERGAKNESLQVSKTLGTYHWEMIWNWHWETQRILPALDSELWEVKTRNSLPLRRLQGRWYIRLSQLFYLLTSSGILQLYTLLFYHSCIHSYTVKRSRMCIIIITEERFQKAQRKGLGGKKGERGSKEQQQIKSTNVEPIHGHRVKEVLTEN